MTQPIGKAPNDGGGEKPFETYECSGWPGLYGVCFGEMILKAPMEKAEAESLAHYWNMAFSSYLKSLRSKLSEAEKWRDPFCEAHNDEPPTMCPCCLAVKCDDIAKESRQPGMREALELVTRIQAVCHAFGAFTTAKDDKEQALGRLADRIIEAERVTRAVKPPPPQIPT